MRVLAVLAAFALLVSAAPAADPPADHTITVDDFFSLALLNEAALSPDGNLVAYTEARWQQSTDDRKPEIWLVPATGGPANRLTFDRADYGELKWSPDSKSIYFTARRKRAGETKPPWNGQRQVWRVAASGGEPVPVTQVPGGIDQFDLAGEGPAVYYTTSRQETAEPFAALRKQFDNVRYGDAQSHHTELWAVDTQSWRSQKLGELPLAVDEMAVAPRGGRVAMVTSSDGSVTQLEGKSAITILDIATGKHANLPDELWRAKAPSPYGRLHSPSWSADGQRLAFSNGYDAYPSELFVARWASADAPPQLSKLALGAPVTLHAGVETPPQLLWRGDSHDLCFPAEDHGRLRIYCLVGAGDAKTKTETLTPGDVVVDAFSLSRSGNRAAVVRSDPAHMTDVYLLQDGQARQLTNTNPHVTAWKLPSVSVFSYQGANGDTVEGILELPPGYQKGQKLPTIINIHGGPTSAIPYRLQYGYLGSVLFAAQGYAYFSPNYHGSTGYGDKFLTDLVGHQNEIEVEDIIKGAEALVAAGIADPNRLGVGGWSNGGYLTNCIIGKTTMFKAASSGAGIVDTVQEWGTNDEPAYPLIFLGGLPWQKPQAYQAASPIYNFGHVKTPTIFHVGENDLRCPRPNSEMAYRAIKLYSDVPTELLVYPGEPHGLTRYKSREAKLTWDLEWFNKYLK